MEGLKMKKELLQLLEDANELQAILEIASEDEKNVLAEMISYRLAPLKKKYSLRLEGGKWLI